MQSQDDIKSEYMKRLSMMIINMKNYEWTAEITEGLIKTKANTIVVEEEKRYNYVDEEDMVPPMKSEVLPNFYDK